jgi:Zn-dependent protease
MAMAWALMVRVADAVAIPAVTEPLHYMGVQGIGINLLFMLLNLLPIPPLDGGRIVSALLPPRLSYRYGAIEQYGMWVLLVLIMVPGLLSAILGPPMTLMGGLMSLLAGLAG